MITKDDYKTALFVQDASNLSGVLHAWIEITTRMSEDGMDTSAKNTHPICKLFADKCADLAKVRDMKDYAEAYEECRRIAEGKDEQEDRADN